MYRLLTEVKSIAQLHDRDHFTLMFIIEDAPVTLSVE
jgi:hypothetical protein